METRTRRVPVGTVFVALTQALMATAPPSFLPYFAKYFTTGRIGNQEFKYAYLGVTKFTKSRLGHAPVNPTDVAKYGDDDNGHNVVEWLKHQDEGGLDGIFIVGW